MKTVLTIAGSDSSGGAGIQADIKTITMNGAYAMSALTALTAQNTTGVRAVSEVTCEFLKAQIDAVFEDIFPDAVKLGMVPSAELFCTIAERLEFYGAKNIVADPVMVSTSGSALMKTDAVNTMIERILPLAEVVTPNIPEAEVLTGGNIGGKEEMEDAARDIGKRAGTSVLVKGGHCVCDADDVLYHDGKITWFHSKRIDNPNTHGTGCTLSSAIAVYLAKGYSLPNSVRKAKEYLTGALMSGLNLGAGIGPVDHGFMLSGKNES